jgi:uncharacterized protein (DUF58 family)
MSETQRGSSAPQAPTDVVASEVSWIANYGRVFGLLAVVGLCGGALLFSRPELVLVAAPVLVSVVRARRPSAGSRIGIESRVGARSAKDAVGYEITVDPPEDAQAVVARIFTRDRHRWDVVVDPGTARSLAGEVGIVHSGPQEIVRIDYALVAEDGDFVTSPKPGPRSRRVISPRSTSLRRLPLPLRMLGLTGGHDSVRPGDGGEFRDVSLFAPGDRLRRIDWKVTARRSAGFGELYVRRSFATADATVLLMMDSRDDVADLFPTDKDAGVRPDEPTSLDLARNAAASVAAAYIKAGDRVGFQDLATVNRIIAPGGGVRQLQRLLPAIARSAAVGAPTRRLRAPAVPAGAIVYVFSTFLDDESATMAELWRVSGHRVVAVDTLIPNSAMTLTREQKAAVRIVSMEREDRLASLRAVGVDVIHWQSRSGESPEIQFGIHARLSRRPR